MDITQRYERILKDLDRLAKDCQAAAPMLDSLAAKVECHRAIKALHLARHNLRLEVFAIRDMDKVSKQ